MRSLTITSVADYLKKLPKLVRTDDIVWFRGEVSNNFNLQPSILRPPYALDRESILIKRFRQNAYPFLSFLPRTEWEWLFLMQHYGVPTRLLDWSENPLVGLYFAVQPSRQFDRRPGRVWCLLPKVYNQSAHHIAARSTADILCFDVDRELEEFLPSSIGAAGARDLPPMAAIASQQFHRIYAQHGVFTIFHRRLDPLETLPFAKQSLNYFIIPANAKPKIAAELKTLKIDRLAIFPDLDSVAKKAKGLT